MEMAKWKALLALFAVQSVVCLPIFGQEVARKRTTIDVVKYAIDVRVDSVSPEIHVVEKITFHWLDTTEQVVFDLVGLSSDGKGMSVKSVADNGVNLDFVQENNLLIVSNCQARNRKEITWTIDFFGIPKDGLIIGNNRYGERTIFGDNWPNRAHNWFVCVDHPSDKAFVDFSIKVPAKYKAIANGELLQMTALDTGFVEYFYRSNVPLPTKVIVIGIAEFVVKQVGTFNNTPVSSWVYPTNSDKALYDLDLAPDILSFFTTYIGPYEFEKLANVQSTTRFGGMENAGCIFYDENALNGTRSSEALIAHEIAHQWFGNSVTEKEWMDIWLSEGFATYFTNLYLEKTYGRDALNEQLIRNRNKVVDFYSKYPKPLVDSSVTNLEQLLNPNSYQKGAWVLHMLRRKIGDEKFKNGVVAYYTKYRLSNANTIDFKREMEKVAGCDLDTFFQQWVFSSGHPILDIDVQMKKRKTSIKVVQTQKETVFSFPLTIQLSQGENDSSAFFVTKNITKKEQVFTIKTSEKVTSWRVDPQVDLLHERRYKW
jgi:aminopeptidase N